jgi:hypothetical protein
MPALTAINNTYTANTPSGVRECLYFLQQQTRARRNRDTRPVDVFRTFPISIVYGYGNVSAGQLVTSGDDLDIIPTQWDRIRRRRWWDVSRTASKQMLLPFPEHAHVRIVNINRYSHSTEIVIQSDPNQHSQLNLTAPRIADAAPGPYTVRAIRIHNVDRSETVPPMRPPADESCQQRPRTSSTAGSPYGYINGDWGRYYSNMVDAEAQDGPERCRPVDAIDWHTAVEPRPSRSPCRERRVRSSEVEQTNPCGEAPIWEAPRPPSGGAAFVQEMRGVPSDAPELPPIPSGPIQEVPRTRRATRTVPIREIVTREDVEREARNHAVSLQRRGLARVHEIRDSDHTVTTRDIPISELTREQVRSARDLDRALAYGSYSHTLGRTARTDT